jgi:hypothetical protein
MSPNEVFDRLMAVMEEDNGFRFDYSEQHRLEATQPIAELQAAGYFADDPDDLDGSFWMAGAGEYMEAPEFFAKALPAFDKLSDVLNRIFNGEE